MKTFLLWMVHPRGIRMMMEWMNLKMKWSEISPALWKFQMSLATICDYVRIAAFVVIVVNTVAFLLANLLK